MLGTQFNLKSYQEDAKSEVSLVRGKVSVGIKASKMNGKLTLAPGDILRFNKTNNHIDSLRPTTPRWSTRSRSTKSSMRSTRTAFSRCAGKPRYITYRHP